MRMGAAPPLLLLPLLLVAAQLPHVCCSGGAVADEPSSTAAPATAEQGSSKPPAAGRIVLEVRPSSTPGAPGGLGLFVSKDSAVVPKGTVLATFLGCTDMDVTMGPGGRDYHPAGEGPWRVLGADERAVLLALLQPREEEEEAVGDSLRRSSSRPGGGGGGVSRRRLVVSVGQAWSGDVPARVEVGSAVGQLCNDPGARLLLDATTMGLLPTADGQQQQPEGRARRRLLTRSGVSRALQAYYTSAPNQANVNFSSDPDFAARSSREINPGEELLLTYGAHNWLFKVMNNAASSPLVRLLVYLAILDANSGSDPDGPLPLLGKISVRTDGTPVLAATGEEADEVTCRDFMRQVLGFSTQHKVKRVRGRRRALSAREGEEGEGEEGGEGGVTSSSWKETLADMVRQLTDQEDDGHLDEEGPQLPPE